MGAFLTLRKLVEDIPNRLVKEAPGASFHELVPALLHSLGSSSEHRRKEALGCLNSFIIPMPGLLLAHMNDYLTGLCVLWVREASILTLCAIADGCREELMPDLLQLHPFRNPYRNYHAFPRGHWHAMHPRGRSIK